VTSGGSFASTSEILTELVLSLVLSFFCVAVTESVKELGRDSKLSAGVEPVPLTLDATEMAPVVLLSTNLPWPPSAEMENATVEFSGSHSMTEPRTSPPFSPHTTDVPDGSSAAFSTKLIWSGSTKGGSSWLSTMTGMLSVASLPGE
jgi:hypothetical protein